jgi:hypothetical protein
VEPKTIFQHGQNSNFVCAKCNDGSTSNSSHPITNGSFKIKSTDSINSNHRDFAKVQRKTSSPETNVANNIRYFEEKQQQQQHQQSQIHKVAKLSDLDRYLPSVNEPEYHHQNGKISNT